MKKLLAMILTLSFLFSLSSCNVDYKGFTVAAAGVKPDVTYKDSVEEGYMAFLEKLDAFAAKLTHEVYSDSEKQTNLCISPVSVYMALALAVECTDGTTRDEILDAVGVSYEEVKRFTGVLYAFSNRTRGDTGAFGNEQIMMLEELSNALFADKSVSLKDAGVKSLANNYNCDLFHVDFGSSEGEKVVAAYIEDKTHGLIEGGVELSPETLITLINTFYLKEVWDNQGDKLNLTKEKYLFKNADGSTQNTRLLEGYYFNGKAYEGDGYTSFFTRTANGFTVKFLLPRDGHTLDEVFTEENIYRINNVTDYGYKDDENKLLHHTRVFFPKYEASYDGDLADILRNDFGITSAFDETQSDFSGITEDAIVLDRVLHRCELKVDEIGIEGAAVTVVAGDGAGAPPKYTKVYHDYIVDRAFGFVITDGYGGVVFSGAVNRVG